MIILCPGQGAQAVGMGRAWFDSSDAARRIFERADAHLGDRLGAPLSSLCFDGPAETLNRTDVSQPAIFTTSMACWAALFDGQTPAYAAGLSLGEYTALCIAGAFTFEDGLELVTLRGQAMQEAAEATASGMVALIGADEGAAQGICDDARDDGVLVCANFNAPGQIVLSGSADACERVVDLAAERSLRAMPLPVAGAFHSPIMAPAAARLSGALGQTPIAEPVCPVLSNVTALPHEGDTLVESIRQRLVEQLTSPVRWAASCSWLVEQGSGDVHELAPGRTLAGLARKIDRGWKVTTHDAPE